MQKPDRLTATVELSSPVEKTVRVVQLSGLFDLPPTERTAHRLAVDVALPETWNVGLIVGPSGCGKSTLARALWPEKVVQSWQWPAGKSIVDGFPAGMSIKDITGLLCSVGFSSPPSWLKPFGALSTGEQFRVTVARTLAEEPELAVIDEFTSVVDRDVAKIASAAVQKAARRRGQKLVAVTCHYDVAEWLEPDWIYYPQTGEFIAGRLLRRPKIELEIARVHRKAWELFKDHHYLTGELTASAACFVGFVMGRPAVFSSVISFPHAIRPGWKEHRSVCLPDFQGVGLGSVVCEFVASLYRATGRPFFSTTSNPAYIAHRLHSPLWKCLRRPSRTRRTRTASARCRALADTNSANRLTSGFEYIGPAADRDEARRFGLIVR